MGKPKKDDDKKADDDKGALARKIAIAGRLGEEDALAKLAAEVPRDENGNYII